MDTPNGSRDPFSIPFRKFFGLTNTSKVNLMERLLVHGVINARTLREHILSLLASSTW